MYKSAIGCWNASRKYPIMFGSVPCYPVSLKPPCLAATKSQTTTLCQIVNRTMVAHTHTHTRTHKHNGGHSRWGQGNKNSHNCWNPQTASGAGWWWNRAGKTRESVVTCFKWKQIVYKLNYYFYTLASSPLVQRRVVWVRACVCVCFGWQCIRARWCKLRPITRGWWWWSLFAIVRNETLVWYRPAVCFFGKRVTQNRQ